MSFKDKLRIIRSYGPLRSHRDIGILLSKNMSLVHVLSCTVLALLHPVVDLAAAAVRLERQRVGHCRYQETALRTSQPSKYRLGDEKNGPFALQYTRSLAVLKGGRFQAPSSLRATFAENIRSR